MASRTFRTVETFKIVRAPVPNGSWLQASLATLAVKYLIQKTDDWTNKEGRQGRARGLEYQLVDLDSPDASDPTRITGALYSLLAPANANWKIGVLNESRIIVHGDHAEHCLNGESVLSYETTNPAIQSALRKMLPKDAALVTDSPISLQNHSSETWFKNIKIRVLP